MLNVQFLMKVDFYIHVKNAPMLKMNPFNFKAWQEKNPQKGKKATYNGHNQYIALNRGKVIQDHILHVFSRNEKLKTVCCLISSIVTHAQNDSVLIRL